MPRKIRIPFFIDNAMTLTTFKVNDSAVLNVQTSDSNADLRSGHFCKGLSLKRYPFKSAVASCILRTLPKSYTEVISF